MASVPLALLAALAAPHASHASGGTWARVETSGPGPSERSTPAVGSVDGSIYLFGGVHDDFRTNLNVFYDDLYRFTPTSLESGTWAMLQPEGDRPAARAFAASAADEERRRLYVFGGATYGPLFLGFIAFDDLWAYDVETERWTLLGAPGSGPSGRSRPNMWIVGDTLYVFGGVDFLFRTFNDLWAFDLETNTWTEVMPNGADGSPPTRHEAQSGTVAANGALTLYGGEQVELLNGAYFDILDDTWQYDLASSTWTEAPPSDTVDPPRNYGAAAIIGDGMFLHGGDIPGGSQGCGAPFPQNPSAEMWRFDIHEQTWSMVQVTGDPVPLKRHVAAVAGTTMYLFAGFDFDCEGPTSPGQIWNTDVYAFQ